ncbi:MAG: PEP-CTERM sorting domain-containing protein [Candidatus Omnitrophica bacterium]|nr:PEP-CTERM sorting domain-containing protein [Candidatus Omnitrophota bacterium]
MKRLSIILLAVLFLSIRGSVFAYTIDGFVNDWGINLAAANAIGYLDNNRPTGTTVDVFTEDNADIYHQWTQVGPGWSYYNVFDAEAIYFDNDEYNIYLAIITGLPFSGYQAPGNPHFVPGDIAFDIDLNKSGYEYALDVSTFKGTQALLYQAIAWEGVYYDGSPAPDYTAANPFRLLYGLNPRAVPFVYSGNQNNHYVLEAAIPLSYFGIDASIQRTIGVHWTMECGNDVLNLKATVNPVPEPGTITLLGLGILGVMGFRKRRMGC